MMQYSENSSISRALLTLSMRQISSMMSATTVVQLVLRTRSVPPGSRYICRLEVRPAEMAAISSMLGTFFRPPYLKVFFRLVRAMEAVTWKARRLS